jgi:hypothetical protein
MPINADAGNLVRSVLFGMMGMPPTTDIATAFCEDIASTSFTCLTSGCTIGRMPTQPCGALAPFARAE